MRISLANFITNRSNSYRRGSAQETAKITKKLVLDRAFRDVRYASHLRRLKKSYQDRVTLLTYDDLTASLAVPAQTIGNFNQRHEFVKGYGVEKGFTHWVEYSWDGSTALISNYGPLDKPKAGRFGYQIRTLEKFNADQKRLKAHFKT